MLRTLAVALEVAAHRPVAVLLQEVVPPALELLAAEQVLGGAYEIIPPADPPMPYYVAVLLDKRRAKQLGPATTVPFPGTQMGRQLLAVAIDLVDRAAPPLLLATAHLESTKDCGPERKRQFAQSLAYLKQAVGAKKVGAAVLGGDLNIRDDEVRAVQRDLGDRAAGIADAWAFCGSPPDAKWTWDTAANNNLGVLYSCQLRFDRVFFCSPGVSDASLPLGKPRPEAKAKSKAPAGAGKAAPEPDGWQPTAVSLVGRSRVPGLGRFPSDHWGVLTSWRTQGACQKVAAGDGGSAIQAPVATAVPVSTSATQPASAQWKLANDTERKVIELDL